MNKRVSAKRTRGTPAADGAPHGGVIIEASGKKIRPSKGLIDESGKNGKHRRSHPKFNLSESRKKKNNRKTNSNESGKLKREDRRKRSRDAKKEKKKSGDKEGEYEALTDFAVLAQKGGSAEKEEKKESAEKEEKKGSAEKDNEYECLENMPGFPDAPAAPKEGGSNEKPNPYEPLAGLAMQAKPSPVVQPSPVAQPSPAGMPPPSRVLGMPAPSRALGMPPPSRALGMPNPHRTNAQTEAQKAVLRPAPLRSDKGMLGGVKK